MVLWSGQLTQSRQPANSYVWEQPFWRITSSGSGWVSRTRSDPPTDGATINGLPVVLQVCPVKYWLCLDRSRFIYSFYKTSEGEQSSLINAAAGHSSCIFLPCQSTLKLVLLSGSGSLVFATFCSAFCCFCWYSIAGLRQTQWTPEWLVSWFLFSTNRLTCVSSNTSLLLFRRLGKQS